ncbi:MAG: arabinofuranosidase catalytic domain-containing protein [Chloroflexota bacterium]
MRRFLVVITLLAAVVSMSLNQQQAVAAGTGPCDIYASGGTPCVAAHSTVRALYGAYSGRLYQVKRASNSQTTDIGTLSAGGFANAAAQNSFCSGTTCTITIIYDQSGRSNHLTPAPAGGQGGADSPANATALPLTVGGNAVYGIFVSAGVGYRNNATSGIATGSGAEGMYMVASGTHVNSGCCFDYGNAETNNLDNGNGHMEAIYLGRLCWFTPCSGSGPWVMADLENGLFAGGSGVNSNNTGRSTTYVTAMLKGNSSGYAIKDGNAQSGSLKTDYSGGLPTQGGYNPMHKEGAIILGIGGDNSKQAVGSFFEGAMTSGFPSDATENSVQANIVAAGYGSGGTGSTSFRITNRNSGKVLDVQQPNTSAGANVGQFAANGNPWQDWTFNDVGGGFFTIVSVNSGMCLDVNGVSTADGANVIQWTCNGGTNQQWQWRASGSFFQLVARHSGKCADVAGSSTADGANVEQRTCATANNFLWSR